MGTPTKQMTNAYTKAMSGNEKQTAKEASLEVIQRLPDDVDLEDILHALYVRQRIERGIKEADEGRLMPHDEVMRKSRSWLRSGGRKARA